jgi:N-acetyl-gamma-glutamyl-phosphate reductase
MVKIGIVGARGFTGGELLRLCLQHPDYRVAYVTSESQAGGPVTGAFPSLAGATDLGFESLEIAAACRAADAFFLALPDGEAMKIAPALLEAGKPVVDVSGDYRVRDRATYEAWYKLEHLSPQLLEQATYGLPELHPEVRQARLVANPGCYPTAALLAVAPLFRERLVETDSLVIDAKSGVSGAGKAPTERTHFCEVDESLSAYGVFAHRHAAEIEQELGRQVTFVPHLVPLDRGILETIYVRVPKGTMSAQVGSVFEAAYAGRPFVRLRGAALPVIKHVAHTNFCDIGWRLDEPTSRLVVVSCIDNLVKGAAGQAVQNFNVALGFDERAGLL